MFHSARLKLTLWYVLITIIITCFFSLLAYNGFRFEFERGLQRQRVFMQQNFTPPSGGPDVTFRRIDPNLQKELRQNLILRILYIDGAVIVVAALGGYFLAGRTLRPIQKMVDEQKRFITDASHELRTPVTALRAEMEASLLDKSLTATDAKTLIKSNLEEVIHLQQLSDDLLELAQYNNPKSTHVMDDISLLQLVEDALKKVMPLAKKKSITVDEEIKDTSIRGDSHELTQLLVILLDNAFKYSPPKSTVKLTSTSNNDFVQVSVIDHGTGIDAADIPHIFNRFYRSDKSRTKKNTSGYGLGLAIAKQIVTRHKGSLNVKSSSGKGTTFTISLPRK